MKRRTTDYMDISSRTSRRFLNSCRKFSASASLKLPCGFRLFEFHLSL
jgi:hypothetical protein